MKTKLNIDISLQKKEIDKFSFQLQKKKQKLKQQLTVLKDKHNKVGTLKIERSIHLVMNHTENVMGLNTETNKQTIIIKSLRSQLRPNTT